MDSKLLFCCIIIFVGGDCIDEVTIYDYVKDEYETVGNINISVALTNPVKSNEEKEETKIADNHDDKEEPIDCGIFTCINISEYKTRTDPFDSHDGIYQFLIIGGITETPSYALEVEIKNKTVTNTRRDFKSTPSNILNIGAYGFGFLFKKRYTNIHFIFLDE